MLPIITAFQKETGAVTEVLHLQPPAEQRNSLNEKIRPGKRRISDHRQVGCPFCGAAHHLLFKFRRNQCPPCLRSNGAIGVVVVRIDRTGDIETVIKEVDGSLTFTV